ncbi:MAG: LysR substrate-binding domain-containing protein [Candidatus Dactylopiibacterium sp.]|nr:LysR substrate-binding domain-containing protein [Candidatus Dactylopiibacterium sp.]
MELKTLRAFIEVVRCGGFTRAAAQLHLTQPAISKMVRALEDEVGVPLLLREGRRLSLTDSGRVVHDEGLAVLAASARLQDELAAISQVVRGVLRLGLPPMVGAAFFAPLVGRFRDRYPGVELRLAEDGARDVEAGVLAGELDLAVTVLPCARPELAAFEFSSEDLCLLAPAGSPRVRQAGVPLAALRDEPLVLFNEGFALAERLGQACAEAGFGPRVAARSGQWDFIAELVAARVGLAFLPRRLCERLGPERFGWATLLAPRIPWRLALVWRREAHLAHAARAFLALAQAEFAAPAAAGGHGDLLNRARTD